MQEQGRDKAVVMLRAKFLHIVELYKNYIIENMPLKINGA